MHSAGSRIPSDRASESSRKRGKSLDRVGIARPRDPSDNRYPRGRRPAQAPAAQSKTAVHVHPCAPPPTARLHSMFLPLSPSPSPENPSRNVARVQPSTVLQPNGSVRGKPEVPAVFDLTRLTRLSVTGAISVSSNPSTDTSADTENLIFAHPSGSAMASQVSKFARARPRDSVRPPSADAFPRRGVRQGLGGLVNVSVATGSKSRSVPGGSVPRATSGGDGNEKFVSGRSAIEHCRDQMVSDASSQALFAC